MLSFASGQALTLYGFRDLVGASTALVAVAADVPPVHPLRPSLLPAPLDIVVATPPRAFRQLTLTSLYRSRLKAQLLAPLRACRPSLTLMSLRSYLRLRPLLLVLASLLS